MLSNFPPLIYPFLFVLGCVIGSFLNVLADRLPEGKWPTGRSMCDGCRRVLGPLELVPMLSWLVQKGKSACCRKSLSVWYPVAEVMTGLVFMLLPLVVGGRSLYEVVLIYVLMSSFLVIFFADVKYHIIPDMMTVVVTVVAFLLMGLQNVPAGLALAGLFYLLYWVTREKGLGFGDVKFAFPMGLLLGFYDSLIAVYIACVLGGVVGLFMVLGRQRKLKSMIAFGPFLVLGTVVMLFFSDRVWSFVRGLF